MELLKPEGLSEQHAQTWQDVQHHIQTRALWDGENTYPIALLERWASGEDLDNAEDALPCGEYLEALLARVGWWMTTVDIALPDDKDLSRSWAPLRQLSTLVAEVLTMVTAAWSQTLIHAGTDASVTPHIVLLARYCTFRRVIVEAIAAAWPDADLSALRDLA